MIDDRTVTREGERGPAGAGRPASGPGVLVLFSEGTIPGRGVYPALPRLSIGRRPDQDIFVEDQGLSREHARLSFDRDVTLCDLASHNGTHINGARLPAHEERRVCHGDVVRCGSTLLLTVPNISCYAGWPDDAISGPMLGGPDVRAILEAIDLVARQGLAVLVTGESGTGKELVATLLHAASERSGRLITVNCAALPAPLFEAELFGVRRGAFTGAATDRPGLVREAHGGTLFLDEIGELPLELQPKLLRVLEEHQVRSVGGGELSRVDLRIVAATNRDLESELAAGRFREDLYHRLCGAVLRLPPLRQRREDILLLARHAAKTPGAPPLSAEAAEALLLHRWPGNVRELVHVVQEAQLRARMAGAPLVARKHLKAGVAETSEEQVRLTQALERSCGNVVNAAADLGVSRGKLYRILEQHGLDPADFRRSRR
jgi:transcriptional regulator of acetoin/glycerol metabolism